MSRHHYEEDSDGSQHQEQHGRKNTFSWSSTSSSNSTLLSTHSLLLQEEVEEMSFLASDFRFLDGNKKMERLTAILSRAASHGDLLRLRQIITDVRLSPYIQLDASDDEDGSTPLIYASCFGKLEVVQYLLQVGAKVDVQDKSTHKYINFMIYD